jgi:predicted DNA binding CopG/RHH family protein
MRTALPRKINICIRMPQRLLETLRREAEREELNLTEYIRAILIAREKPAHDAHAQVS